jgi:hypothetical protein
MLKTCGIPSEMFNKTYSIGSVQEVKEATPSPTPYFIRIYRKDWSRGNTRLLCIWEVLGLNLGWDTCYPD